MTGTFDENIHPCKGCEDFIRPNDCKSKGGCAVQAVSIEVLQEIREDIKRVPSNILHKDTVLMVLNRYIKDNLESVSK